MLKFKIMEINEFVNYWFSIRNLELRDYQKNAIFQLDKLKTSNLPIVLAGATSSGKTLISICYIEYYLKNNPNHNVLVLPHGTTVLKTQYMYDIETSNPEFTYSNDVDCKCNVVVSLPQSLYKMDLRKFDLIIVDEAHQFYQAKMLNEIIKKANPTHQILLTGTPSKFTASKFPIIPITVGELYSKGVVQNIKINILSSEYDYTINDFTEELDLKPTTHYKNDDVINSLFKIKSVFPNVFLEKTIIACKDSDNIKQIEDWLITQNIQFTSSTYKNDVKSEKIERFKTDNDCNVMLVIYRGILGFNYPDLLNVIDFSGSLNVDRIFQLLGRVLRKKKNSQKMFIKISPSSNILKSKVNVAMMMVINNFYEDFYLTYNTDKSTGNQNTIRFNIPSNSSRKPWKESKDIKSEITEFDMHLFHTRMVNGHKFKTTSLQEIDKKLGINVRNFWTLERCMIDSIKYKSSKEWELNSPQAYKAASEHDWLDVCTDHMIKKINSYSFNECVEDLIKFTDNKISWSKSPLYHFARRKGWLAKCKFLNNKRPDKCTFEFIQERKNNGTIYLRILSKRKKITVLAISKFPIDSWDNENGKCIIKNNESIMMNRKLQIVLERIKDRRLEIELLQRADLKILKKESKRILEEIL